MANSIEIIVGGSDSITGGHFSGCQQRALDLADELALVSSAVNDLAKKEPVTGQ